MALVWWSQLHIMAPTAWDCFGSAAKAHHAVRQARAVADVILVEPAVRAGVRAPRVRVLQADQMHLMRAQAKGWGRLGAWSGAHGGMRTNLSLMIMAVQSMLMVGCRGLVRSSTAPFKTLGSKLSADLESSMTCAAMRRQPRQPEAHTVKAVGNC